MSLEKNITLVLFMKNMLAGKEHFLYKNLYKLKRISSLCEILFC